MPVVGKGAPSPEGKHMKLRLLGGLILLATAAFMAISCGGGGGGGSAIGPTVISVTPKDGATAVPPTSLITATFNTPMNPNSLDTTTFYVTAPVIGVLPGTVTIVGNVATLKVTGSMPINTLMTATLTTGIHNYANQYMKGNYVWTFTTGNNGAAPTVVSTIPTSNATGVSPSANVTATFNEAMNASTINGNTFTLAGPGGTLVPSTVSYLNNVGSLNPTAPLLTNTVYTATITTGVTSVPGTPMASNYKWSFTTAAADVAPTVVSTIPLNSATGVSLSSNVSATFSEAMNPATITGTTFTLTAPGNVPVPATVSYANNVAVLNPTAALLGNTLYTGPTTIVIAFPFF